MGGCLLDNPVRLLRSRAFCALENGRGKLRSTCIVCHRPTNGAYNPNWPNPAWSTESKDLGLSIRKSTADSFSNAHYACMVIAALPKPSVLLMIVRNSITTKAANLEMHGPAGVDDRPPIQPSWYDAVTPSGLGVTSGGGLSPTGCSSCRGCRPRSEPLQWCSLNPRALRSFSGLERPVYRTVPYLSSESTSKKTHSREHVRRYSP